MSRFVRRTLVAGSRSPRLALFGVVHGSRWRWPWYLRSFPLPSRRKGASGWPAAAAFAALALAGWVAVSIVPALARRTSLRWLVYQIDYKLTREGIVYLAVVSLLVLAAVNTGNNLLFMVLACLLAGILISGVLSRVVLTGIELKLELPERLFAEQPMLATVEMRNENEMWPSFSLRVEGEGKEKRAAEILTAGLFSVHSARRSSARQQVQLLFPRRGIYHQDAFSIRTKFPFGFLEKGRARGIPVGGGRLSAYRASEEDFEILPLISGEMVSNLSRARQRSAFHSPVLSHRTARVLWIGKFRQRPAR